MTALRANERPSLPRSAVSSSRGPRIASDGLQMTPSIVGWGAGSRLLAAGAARPVVSLNLVAYAFAGARTWWSNGPLGLEQGFVVDRRPAGGRALTVGVGVGGNARLRALGSTAAELRGRSGMALVYDDLAASDAGGRCRPVWLSGGVGS